MAPVALNTSSARREGSGGSSSSSSHHEGRGTSPSPCTNWSCEVAALLPRVVGVLDAYAELCVERYGDCEYALQEGAPKTQQQTQPPHQQQQTQQHHARRARRDQAGKPSQPPATAQDAAAAAAAAPSACPCKVHSGCEASAEEWESQLVRDLDPVLPGVSLCLPPEGEPQHCMLARGHGGGSYNAGPGQQQGQGQGQRARNVDGEALRAMELGATLLHLKAVARAGRAACKAADRLTAYAQVAATRRDLVFTGDQSEHAELRQVHAAAAAAGLAVGGW